MRNRNTPAHTFQLQLWNGSAYVPGPVGDLESMQEQFNAITGPRRIVNVHANRSLNGRGYRKPTCHKDAPDDVRVVVSRYVKWARARGLKQITLYSRGQPYIREFEDFECRYVDPAEYVPVAAPDALEELSQAA